MELATLFEAGGSALTALFILTFLQVILAAGVGAMLVSRKAMPSVISGGVVGLQCLAVVVMTLGVGAVAEPGPTGAITVVSVGILTLIASSFFAVVPAAIHGLFAMVGGLRGEPRVWGRVGLGAIPAAAVLALPLVGGWWVGSGFWELAWLRVVPYALVALLTLPALAGAGEHSAREASASAGLNFALYVGLAEAAARGAFYFLALSRFSSIPEPASKMGFWDNAQATLLQPAFWWSAGTVLAGMLVGLIGLWPSLTQRRSHWAWLGLGWLIICLLPILFADVPRSAWVALSQSSVVP